MEVYALLFSPQLRLFVRKQGESLSCLLFLPLEIANADNVRKLKTALSFEYGPIVNHYFSQVNGSKLCYYHFIIDSKLSIKQLPNITKVEKELYSITKPWDESLNDLLLNAYGKSKGRNIFNDFNKAFPTSYRERNSYSNTILEDIENIIFVTKEQKITFKIVPLAEGEPNISQFKIYHLEELNLSSIMPMLQNIGFNVVAEHIYVIKPFGGLKEVWLHQFILKNDVNELHLAQQNIEEAFHAMWQAKCQNDPYNQLILRANLNYRQVSLIRALSEYLYQIKIGYSKEYIGLVLNKRFDIVKQLVSLFYAMFNPKLHIEERQSQIADLKEQLEKALSLIHDHIEDHIIRRFIDLIDNILRTNYFLQDENRQPKEFISFKINSY